MELSFTFSILVQNDLHNILLIFSKEIIQAKRKITWNSVKKWLLYMKFQGQ